MKFKTSLRWAAIIGFVLLVGAAAAYSFSTARYFALTSPFEGTGSFSPEQTGDNQDSLVQPPSGGEDSDAGPQTTEDNTEDLTLESNWQGSDRVTILVMGLDYRDWEAGDDAPRTDTMILFTIDPLSKTAGMLSIPRDLWVTIPGFEYDRINTAYRNGEVYEMPEGGAGLAVDTVEQLIGVNIDYYALVDFNVFVRLIDEIDGVKLDIPEEITVDIIGPEPPKTLKPGVQTLPGKIALAYARARSTEGGDFDRAQRQQQVILGIRDRILGKDLIPLLLTKSGILYTELASGVLTNMSLREAIDLGLLATTITIENIRRGVIGSEQIIFYTTPEGDQVLKPLPDKIRVLRDFVFGTTGQSSPLSSLTPEGRAQAEDANVAILNATYFSNLASSTVDHLNGLGMEIPIENAGESEEKIVFTKIVDYTGNPYTVQLLVDSLNIQQHLIYLRYDPESPVDVVVSLGDDWAGQFLP